MPKNAGQFVPEDDFEIDDTFDLVTLSADLHERTDDTVSMTDAGFFLSPNVTKTTLSSSQPPHDEMGEVSSCFSNPGDSNNGNWT